MSHASDHPVRCAADGCPASHPGSRWAAIRATRAGWYHSRNDGAYCPNHVPEWVKAWRAR